MTTLADRVRELIQFSHDGNVRAAAAEIGVPQRTMARIVTGDVESPRVDALAKIAAFYGVDAAWLAQGHQGDQQSHGQYTESAIWEVWRSTVFSLDLDRETRDALLAAPSAVVNVLSRLAPDLPPSRNRQGSALDRRNEQRIANHEFWTWAILFRELVRGHGVPAVRDAVTGHINEVTHNAHTLNREARGQTSQ